MDASGRGLILSAAAAAAVKPIEWDGGKVATFKNRL